MKTIHRVVLSLFLLLPVPAAFAGFAGRDLFLPAVGRVAGAEGSEFYSTLWISNPTIVAVEAKLLLLRAGQANLAPSERVILLEAGETRRLDNFVETLFATAGLGALRIRASGEVTATARVYNQAAGAAERDTQGLSFAAVPVAFAIGAGESASLHGIEQNGDFRISR